LHAYMSVPLLRRSTLLLQTMRHTDCIATKNPRGCVSHPPAPRSSLATLPRTDNGQKGAICVGSGRRRRRKHLQRAAGDSSGHFIGLTDDAQHPRAHANTGKTLGRPPPHPPPPVRAKTKSPLMAAAVGNAAVGATESASDTMMGAEDDDRLPARGDPYHSPVRQCPRPPRSQNDQNESIPAAAVDDAAVSITNAPPTKADGRCRVRTDSDEHSAAHEDAGHSGARQHPPAVPPGAPRQRPTSLSRTGLDSTWSSPPLPAYERDEPECEVLVGSVAV